MADNHSIPDRLNHSLTEAYASAAPPYIGKHATVIGDNGKVLRQGTNDWTCITLNPRPFPKTGWTNEHDDQESSSFYAFISDFYPFTG